MESILVVFVVTVVRNNSIICTGCKLRIHKKCSDITDKLKAYPLYKSKRCIGLCRPINGRYEKYVMLEISKHDIVKSFHCLGEEFSPGGGCELANTAKTRAAWGLFITRYLVSKALGCCLTAELEGFYLIQVNIGPYGEKIFNVCWKMNGQCYAGCVGSKLKKMQVCTILTHDYVFCS